MERNRDIARARREQTLGRDLVASDSHYFDAGARRYSAGAADLSHLAGFENMAAGCVVHRVRAGKIAGDPALWVRRVELAIARLGGAFSRWYLDEGDRALANVLAELGYRSRVELGFVLDAERPGGEPRPDRAPMIGPAVTLRSVTTPAHWAAKLGIHQHSVAGLDGYAVTPAQWVAMERRKCTAGYMRPYLIKSGSEATRSREPMTCPLRRAA